MTNKVLIGKVKNELQLKVNLEEKFYHIPEAVMPKNMLPVGYVALFYAEGKTAAEPEVCIRYFGKVIRTELVLREEITSLPSANRGKRYYKFVVDEWKKLTSPIVRDKGGVYAKAFTKLETLLSAKNLSDIERLDNVKQKPKRKTVFFSDEQIANVVLSEDLITATTLAKIISAAGETKIIAAKITKYLLKNGYLKAKKIGRHTCRVSTPKGQEAGIFSDHADKNGDEYYLTLYDKNAQQFVLNHINEIVKIGLRDAYSTK